jgi:hypothetical protein
LPLLLVSCGDDEENLSPPVSVTLMTRGEVCESIRDGLKASPLSSFIALGDCEESRTPSGGHSLWVELSDLALAYPEFSGPQLNEVMIDAAVIVTAYGLRATQTSPLYFKQLFYSFRDDNGSYFEIQPSDMVPFVPTEDVSQDEWNAIIEQEIDDLYPKVIVKSTR